MTDRCTASDTYALDHECRCTPTHRTPDAAQHICECGHQWNAVTVVRNLRKAIVDPLVEAHQAIMIAQKRGKRPELEPIRQHIADAIDLAYEATT